MPSNEREVPYTPRQWAQGDLIEAEKLKALENAVGAIDNDIVGSGTKITSKINQVVQVSENQPIDELNKVWVRSEIDSISVPTEEEFEIVKAKVKDANETIFYEKAPVSQTFTWYQGTIDGTTGVRESSPGVSNAINTTINLPMDSKITKMHIENGYKMKIFKYAVADQAYIECDSQFVTGYRNTEDLWNVKFAILVMKSNEGAILVSNPPTISYINGYGYNDNSGSLSALGATNGQVPTADGNGSWEWATPSGGGGGGDVTDVQVNGVSVVTNGVANVPMASINGTPGAVKIVAGNGLGLSGQGNISIVPAISTAIKSGTNQTTPIVPALQHESVFYGLSKAAGDSTQSASSNAVGTYTDAAKSAIQTMLGISGIIAPVEGATASKAYAIGDAFLHGGALYEATSDIAIGDTIATSGANANCQIVSGGLGGEISELKVALDSTTIASDTDVGKSLSPKTVVNGKVTQWQFVEGGGGGGRPMIWCWGDSLTEGVGGYIMQAENHNAYMAYSYPAWLGQSWDVVNFGARSENIPAIMARQGADPIVLQAALNIPASKDTPVLVQQVTELYNQTTGTGFRSKSGALVKINKEVESAGLNPCRIAGVEGILYREIGNSYLNNEATYNYYFKRLEDGEAVTAPANTEIETYAMRYCHGGVAIIWMGANGGYSSAMDFVNKVNAMVEYGQYDNYLVIISREFSGSSLATVKAELTDPDGFCHVVDLMDQLPYRGYAMAGIAHNSVDTSGWETTDPIKKNAPLLCEYLSGQTGEAQYGALHYSAWGYKAIAKLIQEKLGTMGLTSSGSGGGGTSPGTTNTDEYGTYLFKLSAARTFNGTNYLNTKVKLFDDLSKDWTFAIKWSGTPTCPDGYPANIFCCAKDGLWKGLLYRYYTAGGANILFGSSANNVNGENNMTDNYGSTNVVVIVKHGNEYLVFVNSAQKAFGSTLTYVLEESDAIDLPLIIGARWNTEGTEVQYKTAFTLEDCRIYDAALDESDAIDLYNELAGQA